MKKANKKYFTLNAYAATAVCFLISHREANSQVVYTDIDPDIILNEGGQTAELDLDQNGTIDFWFHNNSFLFYSVSDSSLQTIQDILVGPEISGNGIAGISEYFSAPYGGGFTRYYPYALDSNIKIDESLQWQTGGLQIMALRTFTEGGANCCFGFYCNWYNEDIIETIDHYLVVRFIDDLSQNHYGWLRCDVKDEGRTLILKDYAYELQPDYPILAGDSNHYVNIIHSLNSTDIIVYSFGQNIYVNIIDCANTNISIYNTSGQQILHNKITENNTVIDMQKYSAGVYIVVVKQKEGIYTKKILIE